MSFVKCGVVGRGAGGFENLSKCTQAVWVTARDECTAPVPLSQLSQGSVKRAAVVRQLFPGLAVRKEDEKSHQKSRDI